MNFTENVKNRLTGLTKATGRFPLTTLFLIAAAVTSIIDLNSDIYYETYIVSFILGAFLSATGQVIYERFFPDKKNYNYLLMGISIFLTAGYYLIIKDTPNFSIELSVRTGVAMFAVFISFILIPTIKREITFNENFLISFKSFFISLFFSVIIFGGISLILGAIDQLLFKIDYDWFSYTAIVVFIIFSPLFFLSMIPVYRESQNDGYKESANVPRLLEILISYIIIPISAIFTLILVIYIIINIKGDFWTNNLLEPMLVSYSISIILIYILSSLLENQFALLFRKIAPKVLVPIVIFQVIASILKIREMGVTYTRYFVILYGIYAVVAGVILSIVPVKKNGIIAGLLIIFSLMSIIPPIDAFTISRNSQINNLEKTLIENQMLENDRIISKPNLNNEERKKIVNNVSYLERMEYFDEVSFIPDDFQMYRDFESTFGFRQYQDNENKEDSIFLSLLREEAISIQGYDFMTIILADMVEGNNEIQKAVFTYQDKKYTIEPLEQDKNIFIRLLDENKNVIIEFPLEEIVNKFHGDYNVSNEINLKDATFLVENDNVKMEVIIQEFYINKLPKDTTYWGNLFILIDFK